ncbi:MAG: glycosyltransferase family 4 protein [Bacteroidaceae bacterium]|nr:glycosyltransferase family 4 protein [Bacteroidaceae bacterium]
MVIGYDAKRVFRNFTGLGNYCRSTLDMLERYHPELVQRLYSPSLGGEDVRTERFRERAITPQGLLRGGLWRTMVMGREASRTCDLFHGLSHELPMRLDIPSVVTMHDVAFRTFTEMYSAIDRRIYDLKWAYACRHASHIIAISESTRRDVQRFYGVADDRISVVYQPVHPSYYADPLPRLPRPEGVPEQYNLYVGSINSRKNLLGIAQAMERIPEDRRLPLVVVGNGGEYRRRVQTFIAEKQMERWFVFLGNVGETERLQALYQHARTFIYPSHYEGMGLPVIEAQLCGCPVITSDVSSLPEAGGDAAILVTSTDTDALATAIERVATDDSLAAEMALQGRSRCMRLFHPAALAEQLNDIYTHVAGS